MLSKQIKNIVLRYLFALVLGLGNLFIFYLVLTPLTLYPSFFLLDLFFEAELSGTNIIIDKYIISIIDACVAGSAYYLLIALNLLTPMNIKIRIKAILFAIIALLTVNLARIFVLSVLFVNSSSAFDFSHKILWYGTSSLFVILIWFYSVKLFSIKSMPVYTDYINLKKLIKKKN